MLMAELKTKKNDASVTDFLNAIPDEQRRKDCYTVLDMMRKATRDEPKMYGSSIVGMGTYIVRYANGREMDWLLVGFAPRKQNISLYLMGGLEQHADLLPKLGKYKTGMGCLYINRLSEVDVPTLRKLITQTVKLARTAGRSK
jgi:hypothetical protein